MFLGDLSLHIFSGLNFCSHFRNSTVILVLLIILEMYKDWVSSGGMLFILSFIKKTPVTVINYN